MVGNDEIPILYSTDNYDLYIVKKNGESEKVSSNIRQVEVVDKDIYYVNENGRFMIYNIEDRTETEIASDVYQFMFLNDQLDIVFVNEDYFLYYRNAKEEENTRISSDTVYYFDQIVFDGKQLFYISDDENLYGADIQGENSPERLASDVLKFVYHDNEFYYLNNDYNLFKVHVKDEDPTRLASDVNEFDISNKGVVYLSNDYTLYKLDDKLNNERIATSVMEFYLSLDGDVLYSDENGQLFVNDTKVASDYVEYRYIYGNLVYSTKDNKIVMLENLKDEHIIDEDAEEFDFAYYYDNLVYTHTLDFPDVAGTWESDDKTSYIELTEGGTLKTIYPDEDEMKLNYDEYGLPRTIMAYSDEYNHQITIRKKSDNEIEISRYGYDQSFTKVSKEDVESQINKAKEALDHEDITYLMERYIGNFASAVNYGNIYYISDYIAPGSNLYKEQEKFIENAYDNNIGEELDDFQIKNIDRKDENTYEITTEETFIIWQDGDSKESTSQNKYTAKKMDGEFLLTDIVVGVK